MYEVFIVETNLSTWKETSLYSRLANVNTVLMTAFYQVVFCLRTIIWASTMSECWYLFSKIYTMIMTFASSIYFLIGISKRIFSNSRFGSGTWKIWTHNESHFLLGNSLWRFTSIFPMAHHVRPPKQSLISFHAVVLSSWAMHGHKLELPGKAACLE